MLPELCRSVSGGDSQEGNSQVEEQDKSNRGNEDPVERVLIAEIANVAVGMCSDVDFGGVEPGVGEEDKDEKEGGGKANDEDYEDETVCLLDALD